MNTKVEDQPDISQGMVWLLALACGLIVANLYYAQTLVGPISDAIGLSSQAAGLVVTLAQIGYTFGLIFVVPLGDLLENRRLIFTALLFTATALMVAAFSKNAWLFLSASLGVGIGSVTAQILVPFAAHLSKESTRGETVGKVISGLLVGIMLARPIASLIADYAGWHLVYGSASVAIAMLAVVLRANLPVRVPTLSLPYPKLIGSLWVLFLTTPILRRRAAYHFGLFGAFSLFWTTTPLLLAGPQYRFSQTDIAIFALVGVAGAIASPIAGRLADKGYTRIATAAALVLGILSFSLPLISFDSAFSRLFQMASASILLDMGVAANLVLGQRAIFILSADVRSRLNATYFALFFAGGATGSALGTWVFANFGWNATLLTGLAFPGLAFLYWTTEYFQNVATYQKPV